MKRAEQGEDGADLAPRGGEGRAARARRARRRSRHRGSPAAARAVDTAKAPSPASVDLPHEPDGEQHDAEHQGRDPAHGIRPEQRSRPPRRRRGAARRRDLQALGGLEDDGSEGAGREQAQRADDRGGDVAVAVATHGEHLGRDDEAEPDGDHEQEPGERRHLVEVGRDEPDQAEADEAGAEGEDDAREGEPAARDVPRADGLARPRGRAGPRPASARSSPSSQCSWAGVAGCTAGSRWAGAVGVAVGGAVIAGSSVSGESPERVRAHRAAPGRRGHHEHAYSARVSVFRRRPPGPDAGAGPVRPG